MSGVVRFVRGALDGWVFWWLAMLSAGTTHFTADDRFAFNAGMAIVAWSISVMLRPNYCHCRQGTTPGADGGAP